MPRCLRRGYRSLTFATRFADRQESAAQTIRGRAGCRHSSKPGPPEPRRGRTTPTTTLRPTVVPTRSQTHPAPRSRTRSWTRKNPLFVVQAPRHRQWAPWAREDALLVINAPESQFLCRGSPHIPNRSSRHEEWQISCVMDTSRGSATRRCLTALGTSARPSAIGGR